MIKISTKNFIKCRILYMQQRGHQKYEYSKSNRKPGQEIMISAKLKQTES